VNILLVLRLCLCMLAFKLEIIPKVLSWHFIQVPIAGLYACFPMAWLSTLVLIMQLRA